MERTEGWHNFRRQPVMAILLLLGSTALTILKNIWPLLIVSLLRSSGNTAWKIIAIATGVPAIVLIGTFLQYLNFKFCIRDGDLIVKKGVFAKEVITIPLEKIQAIHIDQNWVHKIVDLVRLSVDSPGTEKVEIKINLKRREADALKQFVLQHSKKQAADMPEVEAQHLITRLSFIDLLKLGITANHLETLAVIAGLSLSFLNDVNNVAEDRYKDLMKTETASMLINSAFFVLYVIIAIFIVSIIASLVRIIFRYANFTVVKTGSGFSVQMGLINSAEQMVTLGRVQYVSWSANWLRRQIPMFVVELHAIGSNAMGRKMKVKLPATSMLLRDTFAASYHTGIPDTSDTIRIAPEYVFRKTLLAGLVPAILIGGIAYMFIGNLIFWLALLPVYVCISSLLFYRNFRLYHNTELIHIRKGAFGRAAVLLKWHKIQSVKLVQGYYQRTKDLADLELHTAGGVVTIPYLELGTAMYLRDLALYKIESSSEAWM